MSGQFTFSFGRDDLADEDDDIGVGDDAEVGSAHAAREKPAAQPVLSAPRPRSTAFPVPGQPQLPAMTHDLHEMLAQLPSKIAYGFVDIQGQTRLPRRELWDVKVQMMAEADLQINPEDAGLGKCDVKTGVYEGGFKSWESSVDLVKVLLEKYSSGALSDERRPLNIVELGCGTALPSLAMFQTIASLASGADRAPISFTLADYNPNVLHLVTLPNMILGWALCQSDNASMKAALETDGELELTSELKDQFLQFLSTRRITLSFLSGGWSEEFVNKLYASGGGLWDDKDASTILLGSETIYSPFALEAFTVTVFSVLCRQMELDCKAELFVAAKRLYFGVGGSLDDFVVKARNLGARVDTMREETEGVRRGVVRCYFET